MQAVELCELAARQVRNREHQILKTESAADRVA
jgi:hypothetical protein